MRVEEEKKSSQTEKQVAHAQTWTKKHRRKSSQKGKKKETMWNKESENICSEKMEWNVARGTKSERDGDRFVLVECRGRRSPSPHTNRIDRCFCGRYSYEKYICGVYPDM